MIQHRTMLKVADNSGARILQVIHVFGGSRRKFGYIGDVLNCVVKEAIPTGQVKQGEIVKVVLVRASKERKRLDGSYIRFSDNAGVVIDNAKDKTTLTISLSLTCPVGKACLTTQFNTSPMNPNFLFEPPKI